ncbi:amidohydrolase/deacetylase family metallohydrolase [Paenibacillus physcomitrellae]|uniref:Dihydroorotase n=1 Tax=Paenibacillus physcomitrellae TaxID=1619311 RepID=A0ABQ1FRE9_9BACL|nr:amidohydrolase/deacetylase family metallohydrolase [Paenibacillus physcomitrellae]GGA26303.1 dihydroorotase [Paenibacillus physcomitrellae]
MGRRLLRNLRQTDGRLIDLVITDGILTEVRVQGEDLSDVHGEGNPDSGGRFDGFDVWEAPAGTYVSSGWIDMHVHAFPEFDPYGDEIDEIGIKQGVTTIVDAGSCGADRIADLEASGRKADTRLLAFLNISQIGLKRIDELSDMSWINRDKVVQAVRDYPDFIVGLKARISRSVVKESGIQPLVAARELSEQTGLSLMVHIGSAPPDIREVVPLLQRKDIITHYLNGKANNLFDADGNPLDVLTDAVRRGVHLDVGHGTASFSFATAEAAKRHGIHPDTISTDIYRGNRLNGPVYSMANVLSKFLELGYGLEETVRRVTVNAADWLGRPELGRIQAGDSANLTFFTVADEATELVDSEGERRTSNRRIEAKGAVVGDKFFSSEIRA